MGAGREADSSMSAGTVEPHELLLYRSFQNQGHLVNMDPNDRIPDMRNPKQDPQFIEIPMCSLEAP